MSVFRDDGRWRSYQRDFHTTGGEYNGVAGEWRVLKKPLQPWEIWFRPAGMGPKARRRKRGYWVAEARTLAAAKEKVGALERGEGAA